MPTRRTGGDLARGGFGADEAHGGGVGVGALARRTGGANEAHVGGLARGGFGANEAHQGFGADEAHGGGGVGRTNEAHVGCQRGARGGIWRGGGLAPMRRTGGGWGLVH